MRWFILGLLFVVVLAMLAMLRLSLMSMRRRDMDEDVKLLPPPADEGQAPGHPDAAPTNPASRDGE